MSDRDQAIATHNNGEPLTSIDSGQNNQLIIPLQRVKTPMRTTGTSDPISTGMTIWPTTPPIGPTTSPA